MVTTAAAPPVQIGSVGLLLQVAIMAAQPARVGSVVHCAKVGPLLVHAPGLAAQRAAQPAREGLAEHWAMVTVAPPVQIGSVGVAVQVAMRVVHSAVGVVWALHWVKDKPVVPPVPAQIAAVGVAVQVAIRVVHSAVGVARALH